MKVTVLGCGSSAGTPLVGCNCVVCLSSNPRNKRSRVSVLIEVQGKNILVDTSPDLRAQSLANGLTRVDVALFTHDHADHTHGIDDMRSFNYLSGGSLPVYANEEVLEVLRQRFSYVFQPKPEYNWYRPSLEARVIPSQPIHDFSFEGVGIRAFVQNHGKGTTLGYRIGDFAYSTDTNHLPETAFEALEGIDTWLVDCLRYSQSPSHANLETSLAWITRVKPRRAILTHMGHDFDYDKLSKDLPDGVEPGYDGMVIEL